MEIVASPSRRSFLCLTGVVPLGAAAISAPALAAVQTGGAGLTITRFDWAGISLQIGDVTLFIDARAPDTEAGSAAPALRSSTSRSFALATHHHGDHSDLRALQSVLGERGFLAVHEDVARLLNTRIVAIHPVRLHEPLILSRQNGEFVAWAVPASDGLGSPQNSWVVEGGGKRIIHLGDTSWHGHWWNIARAYGPFDAAFVPINGYRQTGGMFDKVDTPMGLTPEQAVAAGSILKARLLIPIHFGAFPDAAYVEEAEPLQRFLKAAATAGIAARHMLPGAKLTI